VNTANNPGEVEARGRLEAKVVGGDWQNVRLAEGRLPRSGQERFERAPKRLGPIERLAVDLSSLAHAVDVRAVGQIENAECVVVGERLRTSRHQRLRPV